MFGNDLPRAFAPLPEKRVPSNVVVRYTNRFTGDHYPGSREAGTTFPQLNSRPAAPSGNKNDWMKYTSSAFPATVSRSNSQSGYKFPVRSYRDGNNVVNSMETTKYFAAPTAAGTSLKTDFSATGLKLKTTGDESMFAQARPVWFRPRDAQRGALSSPSGKRTKRGGTSRAKAGTSTAAGDAADVPSLTFPPADNMAITTVAVSAEGKAGAKGKNSPLQQHELERLVELEKLKAEQAWKLMQEEIELARQHLANELTGTRQQVSKLQEERDAAERRTAMERDDMV